MFEEKLEVTATLNMMDDLQLITPGEVLASDSDFSSFAPDPADGSAGLDNILFDVRTSVGTIIAQECDRFHLYLKETDGEDGLRGVFSNMALSEGAPIGSSKALSFSSMHSLKQFLFSKSRADNARLADRIVVADIGDKTVYMVLIGSEPIFGTKHVLLRGLPRGVPLPPPLCTARDICYRPLA